MMLDLREREWNVFLIDDLFDIGTGGLVERAALRDGRVPRISAKNVDNGIEGFYQPVAATTYREFRNFISVSFLGSVFYHPYTASLDMKIHALRLKRRELNKGLALFLQKLIAMTAVKFSYGNQLSSSDLPRQKIIVPVCADGMPDWDFMEGYVRERETMLVGRYFEFANRIEV